VVRSTMTTMEDDARTHRDGDSIFCSFSCLLFFFPFSSSFVKKMGESVFVFGFFLFLSFFAAA